MKKITLKKLLIVLFTLMAVGSLLLAINKGLSGSVDFQWDAAKLLADRINPYDATRLDSSYNRLYADWYGKVEANQFPSLLWLLFPYTLLSAQTAKVAWLISNLFFLVGIIVLLRTLFWKKMDKIDFILLVTMLLASGCVRSQIHLGQHSLYAFFFFLLSVWLSKGKKRILSGLALSASYFKYSITAPLMLFFLYKKKYKEVIVSFIPHIVLTLFSSWWLGVDPITILLQPIRQATTLLTGCGFADLSSVFYGLGISGNIFNIATVVIFLGLFLWVVFGKEKISEYGMICILSLWSLIFMYHRRYDYFLLILPFAALFMDGDKKGRITKIWSVSTVWATVGIMILGNFMDMESSVGQSIEHILGSFLPYASICRVFNMTFILALYIVLITNYLVFRNNKQTEEREVAL